MSNITKHENTAAVAVVEEKTLVSYLDAMGLVPKLSDQEKTQFLQIAKASNLNPFKREIYAAKYKDNLSIITGYEVYIKRAERTGLLNGWKVDIAGSVAKGDLRAKITIYRKDQEIPFEWEVWYQEYVQMTWKDGKQVPNKMWSEKPVTMTKKVSISQGFRLCFSDELGGMPYTAEEIDSEQTYEAHYTEVNEPAPKQEAKPAAKKERVYYSIHKDENGSFRQISKEEWEKERNVPQDEPEVVEAETVEEQAPPSNPITKGQKEILKPLLSSPLLTDEEKERVKGKMEGFSKEQAEKTIETLMGWIKKRKEKAAA